MTRIGNFWRGRSAVLRGLVLVALGAGIAALVLGGDSDDGGDRRSGDRRDELDLGAVITEKDLDRYPKGSAEAAFLQFWSSLQFGGLDRGVQAFDPRLRDFITGQRLSEALKARRVYFGKVKPRIFASTDNGDETDVRYTLEDEQGTQRPHSITFRRSGGRWLILFDSSLDDTLRAYAQSRTQQKLDPTAKEPVAEAIKAGDEAARLQSEFADKVLGNSR